MAAGRFLVTCHVETAGQLLAHWQLHHSGGLSWKEVAGKLGVDKTTMSRLRYNRCVPLLRTARAIADLTKGMVPVEAWDRVQADAA